MSSGITAVKADNIRATPGRWVSPQWFRRGMNGPGGSCDTAGTGRRGATGRGSAAIAARPAARGDHRRDHPDRPAAPGQGRAGGGVAARHRTRDGHDRPRALPVLRQLRGTAPAPVRRHLHRARRGHPPGPSRPPTGGPSERPAREADRQDGRRLPGVPPLGADPQGRVRPGVRRAAARPERRAVRHRRRVRAGLRRHLLHAVPRAVAQGPVPRSRPTSRSTRACATSSAAIATRWAPAFPSARC